MGMRSDQDIVAEDDGVPRPAADHGVLHHDAAGADADLPILGGEHGPEQHAGIRPDAHRAADDRRGRDISTRMDLRDAAAVLNQHAPSLPGPGPLADPPEHPPPPAPAQQPSRPHPGFPAVPAVDAHARVPQKASAQAVTPAMAAMTNGSHVQILHTLMLLYIRKLYIRKWTRPARQSETTARPTRMRSEDHGTAIPRPTGPSRTGFTGYFSVSPSADYPLRQESASLSTDVTATGKVIGGPGFLSTGAVSTLKTVRRDFWRCWQV